MKLDQIPIDVFLRIKQNTGKKVMGIALFLVIVSMSLFFIYDDTKAQRGEYSDYDNRAYRASSLSGSEEGIVYILLLVGAAMMFTGFCLDRRYKGQLYWIKKYLKFEELANYDS